MHWPQASKTSSGSNVQDYCNNQRWFDKGAEAFVLGVDKLESIHFLKTRSNFCMHTCTSLTRTYVSVKYLLKIS